jgi:hypothetical protein
MHRIHAPRLVITGRATSTTASSWEWVHGPAGVITTVGAGIASSLPAVEDITVASVGITEMPAPVPPSRITINLTPRPRITANLMQPQRITANLTQPQRITANPTPLLTPPPRMAGNLTVEAGKLMAGNLMVGVENTTSQ